MDWDLSTLEHHDSCPWEEHCNILTQDENLGAVQNLCVWCFVLHQAEWAASVLRAIGQDLAEEIALLKRRAFIVDNNAMAQPQTRWDQYD